LKLNIGGTKTLELVDCDGSTYVEISSDEEEEDGDRAPPRNDTINYEIVCMISKRVPRVYIKDGKIVDVLNNIIG